jgi:hypothetical protein
MTPLQPITIDAVRYAHWMSRSLRTANDSIYNEMRSRHTWQCGWDDSFVR